MCATCKHAVIPVDDPNVVARILRAKKHLEMLESNSMYDHEARARFDKVYRPILTIITRDIIARISAATLKVANKLAPMMPDIPVLI
ncbi:hypothetical protein D3C77_631700 [compost metagenome]